MKRSILALATTIALTIACASQAEARIFEPQRDWWNSGHTCIESRNPPGLAWDDLPPRACVVRENVAQRKTPHADNLLADKNDFWTIAFIGDRQAGKATAKSNSRA